MSRSALDDVYAFAEGRPLFVELSLQNNVTGVIYTLSQSPEVKAGIDMVAATPELAEEAVGRVKRLLTQELPSEELHPYDVAITAYLFLLYHSNANACREAMRAVRGSALRNLHWAISMYAYLTDRIPRTDNQSVAVSAGDRGEGVETDEDAEGPYCTQTDSVWVDGGT